MQADRLRVTLRRDLGAKYSDELWHYLEEKGYVDDALAKPDDPSLLAREARKLIEAATSRPTQNVKVIDVGGPTAGQERAWALSQLVADLATKDPDVVAFRARDLPTGLIKYEEVKDWIEHHNSADGERTVNVTVSLPRSAIRMDRGTLTFEPTLSTVVDRFMVGVNDLPYALPGDRWMSRVSVVAGGVLDRLQALTKTVADAYAWDAAQATLFVLSGVIPLVEPVRVSSPAFKVRHQRDHGWAKRIRLDVDPAATPDEVVDAFLRARRQSGIRQLRPLSAKHARLAAFTGATHTTSSWAKRLRLWNEEFPQWHYEAASNFRRDAIRAQARILYPGRYVGQARLRPLPVGASG